MFYFSAEGRSSDVNEKPVINKKKRKTRLYSALTCRENVPSATHRRCPAIRSKYKSDRSYAEGLNLDNGRVIYHLINRFLWDACVFLTSAIRLVYI